jgi:hypothetical protein
MCFGCAARSPPAASTRMRSVLRSVLGRSGAARFGGCRVVFVTLACPLVLLLASAPSASAATWSLQTVPKPEPSTLNGVSCTSKKACVAVGSIRTKQGTFTLVERWNGKRWSIQPSPNPPGSKDSRLSSVSCTTSRFCVAVGDSTRPGPRPGPPAFTASSPREFMLVERWDGRRWSLQPIADPFGPRDAGLAGVSCTSKVSCMAVGSLREQLNEEPVGVIERWDGSTWTVQRIHSKDPYLEGGAHGAKFSGVSCHSNTSCTAVGAWGGEYIEVEAHWNGNRWSSETGGETTDLNAVSCISQTACVAVGSTCCEFQGILIEGWDRHSSYNPNMAGSPTLNGVSCTSKRACIEVGTINFSESVLIERWDGIRWREERPPFTGELTAVSCTSNTACTAVGHNGPNWPYGAIVARYS